MDKVHILHEQVFPDSHIYDKTNCHQEQLQCHNRLDVQLQYNDDHHNRLEGSPASLCFFFCEIEIYLLEIIPKITKNLFKTHLKSLQTQQPILHERK